MLVVIAAFAVIGIVASETVILTLRSTSKADSSSKVRQNVDYAVNSMERVLRGAKSITSVCNGSAQSSISFLDQSNNTVTYSCVAGTPAYIASNSATITSSEITFSTCSFTCTPAAGGTTSPQVTIDVAADDLLGQNTHVSSTTQITLRSY